MTSKTNLPMTNTKKNVSPSLSLQLQYGASLSDSETEISEEIELQKHPIKAKEKVLHKQLIKTNEKQLQQQTKPTKGTVLPAQTIKPIKPIKETVLPAQSLNHTKEKNLSKKTQTIPELNYDDFMKQHITTDDYTHTSFIGGKWYICDDDLDTFYKLYSSEFEKGRLMYVTEKHKERYGPIIIDFDFKYSTNMESPITRKITKSIADNLTNIIKESFSENENFMCIISKREKIYQDKKSKKYKDGIHIIFPFIVTSYDYQYALREKYLKVMKNDIKDIPYESIEKNENDQLKSIYDKSVIEDNNWFLYLSTKPNTKPYIIFDIYNSRTKLKDINSMDLIDIVRLMSIRNKLGKSEKSDTYNDFMMDYYNYNKFDDDIKASKKFTSVNNDEDTIVKLLDILSTERKNYFKEWIKIGFILHNSEYEDKTIDYFQLWKNWSMESEAYTEGCCEYFWHKMKNTGNGLKLGSLYYYAETDNSIEYANIIKTSKTTKKLDNDDIINILEGGHYSLAQYFAKNHKDSIIISNSNIYIWNNDTKLWELSSSFHLIERISHYISELLKTAIKNTLANDNFNKTQFFTKLLSKYTHTSFTESVKKLCMSLLENKKFESIVDGDRHTLNFKNGLYDMKQGLFRERTKTDYVSKCLDINYSDKINTDIKKEIMRIFKQISNDDEELLEFNLGWFGYCLTGETALQKFLIVVGHTAQNGKSTLAKMFMKSLPIYSEKLDRRTFSEGYTNAHKQFARIKKPVRFVFVEELDRKNLDCERLKDFVDGDQIGGNEVLYGTAENIDIHCKLYCTSNKDPVFDTDEGIARRGILEILKNRFYDKDKYDSIIDKSGIYIKDNSLDKKFLCEPYAMAFISILLPYAKKYYEESLHIPKKIEKEFLNLCEDNDLMKLFIDKFYEQTGNDDDRVHKDDLVELYNYHYNTKHKWNYLMSDVKRLLTYDRVKRTDGKQGSILGIKRKDEDNDIEEE